MMLLIISNVGLSSGLSDQHRSISSANSSGQSRVPTTGRKGGFSRAATRAIISAPPKGKLINKKTFPTYFFGTCCVLFTATRPYIRITNTDLLHGAESFLRSENVLSYSRNSQHFMETEGSSPHSQKHATCPYPEPD